MIVILILVISSASTAYSSAILRIIGVEKIEGMPVETSGLLSTFGHETITTKHIHSICNRFKMCWINTGRNTAQMVKWESIRDWTFQEFVGKAMSTYRTPVEVKRSISIWKAIACPQPASVGLFDLFPKPFFHRFCGHKNTPWLDEALSVS